MNVMDALFHPRLDAIEAFARNTVSEPERQRTAAHLRECVHCQEALRDVRSMMTRAMSDEGIPEMTAELRERVLARVVSKHANILPVAELPHASRHHWPQRMAVMLAAAAVVLALIVVPRRGLDAGPTAGS